MKSLANGFKAWFAQEMVESRCEMSAWLKQRSRILGLEAADHGSRMMSYVQQYLGCNISLDYPTVMLDYPTVMLEMSFPES